MPIELIWTCNLKHAVDCKTISIFEYIFVLVLNFQLHFVVSWVAFSCVCVLSTLCMFSGGTVGNIQWTTSTVRRRRHLLIWTCSKHAARPQLPCCKRRAEMTTDWHSSSSYQDFSSLCFCSTLVELHKTHFWSILIDWWRRKVSAEASLSSDQTWFAQNQCAWIYIDTDTDTHTDTDTDTHTQTYTRTQIHRHRHRHTHRVLDVDWRSTGTLKAAGWFVLDWHWLGQFW